jgi:chromosome partitioning protein
MNISTAAPPLSLNRVVRAQALAITGQLANHRLASFPPTATKEFRKLTPSETIRYLGVTDSYLRRIASELNGPTEPGHPRRSYTLEDVATLRQVMDRSARTPGKYVPHRRDNEHLQCIAIVNFKGGSGKTTTAANLSQFLALNGFRTLAIDLDPQASLTTLFGLAPEMIAPGQTLYGALRYDSERLPIRSVIRKTYIPGLDLIPAAIELMEFEHETPRMLTKSQSPDLFLRRVTDELDAVDSDYDLVIIDCPPQLGFLTLSALGAATSVLVTVHPQMLDVMSMGQFLTMLSELLDVVASATKSGVLPFDWIRYLITRFEPSDGPQNQMMGFLRAILGDSILQNATLKSTAISDAGLTSQTIYEVDRNLFTRSTYDRALDSVNSVNGEILNLIRSVWGRA